MVKEDNQPAKQVSKDLNIPIKNLLRWLELGAIRKKGKTINYEVGVGRRWTRRWSGSCSGGWRRSRWVAGRSLQMTWRGCPWVSYRNSSRAVSRRQKAGWRSSSKETKYKISIRITTEKIAIEAPFYYQTTKTSQTKKILTNCSKQKSLKYL